MQTVPASRRHPPIAGLCASLCLLWLAGCGLVGHVNHLRDAQDAFSRAAAAENRALFAARLEEGSAARIYATGAQDAGQISTGYIAALKSLDELTGDPEAVEKLRSDRLYGNVLALRALAYWRLQRLEEAERAAEEALINGLEPGSRDFALMTALPGLVANDRAHEEIYTPRPDRTSRSASSAELDSVLKRLNRAEARFCTADRTLPADHPLRVYLGLSALASLRNVVGACEKVHGTESLAALDCFREGELRRDQRAQAYFDRLVEEFDVSAAAVQGFVLGVPMTPGDSEPCPRPELGGIAP